MGRSKSPPFEPKDFPPPEKTDLDFENPPAYLKDPLQRIFWCLNENVRNKILENWPQNVLFCFYKGFCTFQVVNESPDNLAKQRMLNHFQKHPNHQIDPEMLPLWDKLAKERRDLRDESKQKQNTSKSRQLQTKQERQREVYFATLSYKCSFWWSSYPSLSLPPQVFPIG